MSQHFRKFLFYNTLHNVYICFLIFHNTHDGTHDHILILLFLLNFLKYSCSGHKSLEMEEMMYGSLLEAILNQQLYSKLQVCGFYSFYYMLCFYQDSNKLNENNLI